METTEKTKDYNFKVCGANWNTQVTIDPDGFEDPDALIMEVATRGVEQYLAHDFILEDESQGSSGFGTIILVEYPETSKQWALSSDKVLYNASKHDLGKKMEKRIKRKR